MTEIHTEAEYGERAAWAKRTSIDMCRVVVPFSTVRALKCGLPHYIFPKPVDVCIYCDRVQVWEWGNGDEVCVGEPSKDMSKWTVICTESHEEDCPIMTGDIEAWRARSTT